MRWGSGSIIRAAGLLVALSGTLGCNVYQYRVRIEELEQRNLKLEQERAELERGLVQTRTLVDELKKQPGKLAVETAAEIRSPASLSEALRKAGAEVVRRGGQEALRLPAQLLFQSGSAKLRPGAKEQVGKIAQVLKSELGNRSLQIEGHTDSVSPQRSRNEFPTNWHLGFARAFTIMNVLQEYKIPPDQMYISTFAHTRPKVDNHSTKGQEANRRVEILIVGP